MITCEPSTSVIVEPARSAIERMTSAPAALSPVATTVHEGSLFQAGAPVVSEKPNSARGRWEALNAGDLAAEDAAMAKWWCTEMQGRVVDRCLQLHGGYGYMSEYPIAKAIVDARVTTIYGGTTEIMKEIIGRSLQLG